MIKVLKFGGTSVGSAANMKKVAEIVRREQARITVLSAMSGTTDSLVRISRRRHPEIGTPSRNSSPC